MQPDSTHNPRLAAEQGRRQTHLATARDMYWEALTPMGARWLFDKTAATVRLAARKGLVESPFTLRISGAPVRFLRLSSAVRYWGEPEGFADRLRQMRSHALTFGLDVQSWAVLHPKPLVTLSDPGKME